MNAIKKYPEVGDIAIYVDDQIKFLGQDATPEFVETQQCIGVVYFVNGNHVKVVGGKDATGYAWSCVADFEIETIPTETGDYPVTLIGKKMETDFHYEKTEGTKEEFVQQLNAYLYTNQPKCEAYMHNGVAVLQISDYSEYSNTNTIGSCKLRKRVGEELADITTSKLRTQGVKSSNVYTGLCRARLQEWSSTSTDKNSNPTKRMDGITQLFETFPCSEAYYNSELGDGLREHYPTYDLYMDACMAILWEMDHGIMQYRDGKAICDRLKDKKVLVRGVEKYAYQAVRFAVDYDAGVPGFGAGAWWLPSLHEMGLLMRDITKDTKKPLDKINSSLKKKKGWNTISASDSRWSCCRCNVNGAWYFHGNGFAINSNFCYAWLRVSAVSAFNLNF